MLLRIIAFCKRWTDESLHYQILQNKSLLTNYKTFVEVVNNLLKNENESFANKIRRPLLTITEKLNQPIKIIEFVPYSPAPKPVGIPKGKNVNINTIKVYNLRAVEIARQMTILQFEIFKQIKPHELLNNAWTKKDKEKLAPNALKMATQFNHLTWFFVSMVLREKEARKRDQILKKYISLAKALRQLNNYNGLQIILAAFSTSPLARLKETKKRLNASGLEELKQLMASDKNAKRYREALHDSNPPLVPYLGRFLTDLVFAEEGSKSILENKHIHFRKCFVVAEIIQEIKRYQQTQYNLQKVELLQEWLLAAPGSMNEEECYQMSISHQPIVKSAK